MVRLLGVRSDDGDRRLQAALRPCPWWAAGWSGVPARPSPGTGAFANGDSNHNEDAIGGRAGNALRVGEAYTRESGMRTNYLFCHCLIVDSIACGRAELESPNLTGGAIASVGGTQNTGGRSATGGASFVGGMGGTGGTYNIDGSQWTSSFANTNATAGATSIPITSVSTSTETGTNSSTCSSGLRWCSGACVNDQADRNNCGGCGIVCSSNSPSKAEYNLGRCWASLASGQNPMGIAVDGTSVYWTNYDGTGTVRKVPIDGGPLATLGSGFSFPSGITVDTRSVYWTDYDLVGAVWTFPIGGGVPTMIASGQVWPRNIVVDSTSVYWTNEANADTNTTLMKMPIGGGIPITLASSFPG